MRFEETPLPGCFVVELDPKSDERGFFVRTYCAGEFAAKGLVFNPMQSNSSHNRLKGTLRGLHFQAVPGMEAKLVRCERGAIFDVAVDLRPQSSTFGRWFGACLSDDNFREMFIPEGFAHGFQTLCDDVLVTYQISPMYEPRLSAGVAWNDPDIGVVWPLPAVKQSDRDLALPTLNILDRALLGGPASSGSVRESAE